MKKSIKKLDDGSVSRKDIIGRKKVTKGCIIPEVDLTIDRTTLDAITNTGNDIAEGIVAVGRDVAELLQRSMWLDESGKENEKTNAGESQG